MCYYLPGWTLWTSVFQNDIHDSFTCRFKLNHWSRWSAWKSAWKTLLSGHNKPSFYMTFSGIHFFFQVCLKERGRRQSRNAFPEILITYLTYKLVLLMKIFLRAMVLKANFSKKHAKTSLVQWRENLVIKFFAKFKVQNTDCR